MRMRGRRRRRQRNRNLRSRIHTILFGTLLWLRTRGTRNYIIRLVNLLRRNTSLIMRTLPKHVRNVNRRRLFLRRFTNLLRHNLTNYNKQFRRLPHHVTNTRHILRLRNMLNLRLFSLNRRFVRTNKKYQVRRPLPRKGHTRNPTITRSLNGT